MILVKMILEQLFYKLRHIARSCVHGGKILILKIDNSHNKIRARQEVANNCTHFQTFFITFISAFILAYILQKKKKILHALASAKDILGILLVSFRWYIQLHWTFTNAIFDEFLTTLFLQNNNLL